MRLRPCLRSGTHIYGVAELKIQVLSCYLINDAFENSFSMKNSYELGQDQFDALLGLFSADREVAGEKYEQMRSGLMRFFQFKGCHDPDALADDTINRVASKIADFDPKKNIKPSSYFYGFASNVLLEYKRTSRQETSLGETQYRSVDVEDVEDDTDARSSCLHKCLGELPPHDKGLIVDYYTREGREKMELRKQMCDRFGCTTAALHTRVFRIKATLRHCIEDCVK